MCTSMSQPKRDECQGKRGLPGGPGMIEGQLGSRVDARTSSTGDFASGKGGMKSGKAELVGMFRHLV